MSASAVIGLSTMMAGCSKESPIITYQIPTTVPAALATEETRIVGAILPQANQAWFFKIKGRKSAVDSIADPFRQFVEHIQFENGEPVIDDLPEDWRRGADRQMRFASIDINTPTEQLDLSISPLSRSDDWDMLVTSNVDRWRGQVGLKPAPGKWSGAEELDWKPADSSENNAESDGAAAIWVDVTGRPPKSGSPMMGNAPFAAAAGTDREMPADPHAGLPRSAREAIAAKSKALQASSAEDDASDESDTNVFKSGAPQDDSSNVEDPASKLKFSSPEGWRDGKMNSMRLAAFNAGPEDATAEVTIISAGGNLRNNVARWMGQITQSAVPDGDVDAVFENAEKLEVGGRPAQRFVLMPPTETPEAGNDDAIAIDGTVVPLSDDFAMFIKMTGPAETVRSQADEMKMFLESLQF